MQFALFTAVLAGDGVIQLEEKYAFCDKYDPQYQCSCMQRGEVCYMKLKQHMYCTERGSLQVLPWTLPIDQFRFVRDDAKVHKKAQEEEAVRTVDDDEFCRCDFLKLTAFCANYMCGEVSQDWRATCLQQENAMKTCDVDCNGASAPSLLFASILAILLT